MVLLKGGYATNEEVCTFTSLNPSTRYLGNFPLHKSPVFTTVHLPHNVPEIPRDSKGTKGVSGVVSRLGTRCSDSVLTLYYLLRGTLS